MSAHRTTACLCLAFTSQVAAAVPVIPEGSVRQLDASTVEISGFIAPGLDEKFRKMLRESTRTVVLTSAGGVTKTAIEMGELIQARGLDVVVRRYCISSCANYLFIAGRRKSVEKGAVVAWHGGHTNDPVPPDATDRFAIQENVILLHREQLLYLRAHTSIDLIVYSGLLTAGRPTGDFTEAELMGRRVKLQNVERDYSHWVPTYEHLTRLGVRGLDSFWHAGSDLAATALLKSYGFADANAYTGAPYSYTPRALRLSSVER